MGCSGFSQRKLDRNWINSVKGRAFGSFDHDVDGNEYEFMVFKRSGNISIKDSYLSVLVGFMGFNFVSSPAENKGIYKLSKPFSFVIKLLRIENEMENIFDFPVDGYFGFSLDGNYLHWHRGGNSITDIDWDDIVGTAFIQD